VLQQLSPCRPVAYSLQKKKKCKKKNTKKSNKAGTCCFRGMCSWSNFDINLKGNKESEWDERPKKTHQCRKQTLNLFGRERRSFTLMLSPMSVAIEQCGIVGVK
jgi:hypothetical protein